MIFSQLLCLERQQTDARRHDYQRAYLYLRIGAGDKGTRSDHLATSAQQVVLQAMIGRAHTTHD